MKLLTNDQAKQILEGRPLQLIYLENVLARHDHSTIESRELWLSVGSDEYIQVSAKWNEDSETGDDYAILNFRLLDNIENERKRYVWTFGATSTIAQVTLYSSRSCNQEDSDPEVDAVLIERVDKLIVCIAPGGTAFRNLKLISNVDQVELELSCRKVTVGTSEIADVR